MKKILLVILILNINLTLIIDHHFIYRRVKGDITVKFKDENFERAVREIIHKPQGELTIADLQSIQVLDLSGKGIKDISGIEYMENLRWLDISNNQIADLSPLKPLLESGRVEEINVVGNPLTVRDLQLLTIWAGHDSLNLRLIMKLEQTGFTLAEIQGEFFIYTDGLFEIWEKDGKIVRVGNATTGKILLADPKGNLNIRMLDIKEKSGERRLILYGEKIILVAPDAILDARKTF